MDGRALVPPLSPRAWLIVSGDSLPAVGRPASNQGSDLVPPAGLEPATWRLEVTRSIQLSYGGAALRRNRGELIAAQRPLGPAAAAAPCTREDELTTLSLLCQT